MAVSRISTQSIQQSFPKGNTVWDGTTSVTGMDAISVVTLTAAQPGIEFNNIPQTYQHLIVRGISLGSNANSDIIVRCNNVSTAVYSQHGLYGIGNASTPSTTYGTSATAFYMASNAGDTTYPTTFVAEFLDYKDTGKYKVARVLGGYDRNGSGQIQFYSGTYQQTTAISSIQISTPAGNLNANTKFALYGVK